MGVNRTGEDENGYRYRGDSMALDFLGERLAHLENETGVVSVNFDRQALRNLRERLPFLADQL